jgi:hypothetical protein
MANIRKKRRFGCFLSSVVVFFAHGTAEQMGWLIQYFKAIQHEYLAEAVGTIVFHADVTRMSEQMLHRKSRSLWEQMRLLVRSGRDILFGRIHFISVLHCCSLFHQMVATLR